MSIITSFDRFEKKFSLPHARARVCKQGAHGCARQIRELGPALDLFFDHGDHLEGKLIWISAAVNSSPANHILSYGALHVYVVKVKLDLGLDKCAAVPCPEMVEDVFITSGGICRAFRVMQPIRVAQTLMSPPGAGTS